MTITKHLKELGLTLTVLVDKTEQSKETLTNWYNNSKKRKVFNACVFWVLNK